jgi:hypothetical protein
LTIPLKNIQVVTRLKTHYKERSLIKPDIKTVTAIKSIVDSERMKDTIYCAEQVGDDESLYTLERTNGPTKVILNSLDPVKDAEDLEILDGVYFGNCFRMNYDPGEDDLIFQLTMPEEQFNTIAKGFQSDPSSTIDLHVELLSYSFEVDDALREPYHPRDLFIHGAADAFIARVELASNLGIHTCEENHEDEYSYEEDIKVEKEMPLEYQMYREVAQILLNIQKPLNSIVVGIWVIALILGASVFF